jgi:hypothetical protein
MSRSFSKLRSVAVWNDTRGGWPFEVRMILKHRVRVLSLLEIKINSYKEIHALTGFLKDYSSVAALSLIHKAGLFGDACEYCGNGSQKRLPVYQDLFKLSIAAHASDFQHIFHQLPDFPNLESLRCIVLASEEENEELALDRVANVASTLPSPGNRLKQFSIVSMFALTHGICARIGPSLFTRQLATMLVKLEHIYVASGGHIHLGPSALMEIAAQAPKLTSFHIISLPTNDPTSSFNRIEARLSAPSRQLPEYPEEYYIPCIRRTSFTIDHLLQFTSKLTRLQYLSLQIDATHVRDPGEQRAPALLTLHVGNSMISPILKESVGNLMATCFGNIQTISHGFGDSSIKSQEQADAWSWVAGFVRQQRKAEGNYQFYKGNVSPERYYHEMAPIYL